MYGKRGCKSSRVSSSRPLTPPVGRLFQRTDSRTNLNNRRPRPIRVNLAAGAAGAGVAHLPEIVFCSKLEDAILRHTLSEPQVVRFGIARDCVFAFKDGYI